MQVYIQNYWVEGTNNCASTVYMSAEINEITLILTTHNATRVYLSRYVNAWKKHFHNISLYITNACEFPEIMHHCNITNNCVNALVLQIARTWNPSKNVITRLYYVSAFIQLCHKALHYFYNKKLTKFHS